MSHNFLKVVSGAILFVCLLVSCSDADGAKEIACWGGDEQSMASPPEGLKVKQYAVAEDFACGIDENDKLQCWGGPTSKLSRYRTLANAPVGTEAKFVALDSVMGNGCILKKDGSPYCWGDSNHPAANNIDMTKTYSSLYLGPGIVACGVTTEGKVSCYPKLLTMIGIDANKKVAGFKANNNYACWKYEDSDALNCSDIGSKHEHDFKISSGVKEFGVISTNKEVWYIDANSTLHILDKGQERQTASSVRDFAKDSDSCILRDDGSLECKPWGGYKDTSAFGPTLNVPDGEFASVKMFARTVCATRK